MELPIVSTDNRDTCCTRIYVNDTDYVEVDPIDLYDNAIENSLIGEGLEELKGLINTGATSWDDVYEWVIKDYHDRLANVCGWEEAEHLYLHIQDHYFGIEDPADA